MIERGGLRVTTSLDLNLQRQAESSVSNQVALLRKDHNVHDGALIALDPKTGQILSMVGSADYNDASIQGSVNVALANRQPGSAIKPFTYAAAFAKDYTPATIVEDIPTAFPTKEGVPYLPQNYDLQFHGSVTLRTALANSYNIPAVKVLAHVGIPAMLMTAHAAGITTMNDVDRYGLALTLGGGEVRLLDLTSAYATFDAGGMHHDPVAILQVTNTKGQILDAWQPSSGRRAVSPQVAYLITSILSDNNARLPEFGVNSPLRLDRPAAAKTGTTTDYHDNWTVGYTPELVTGVWIGNADNTPMRDVSGISGAAPVWHDFMERALQSLPSRDFAQPSGIVTRTICPGTGLPPTLQCSERLDEVFIAGMEPKLPKHPLPESASIVLQNPPTGSQYQLSLSIPRQYQAIPVTISSQNVVPGSIHILLDGHDVYRLSGVSGEWLWNLQLGTHHIQAEGKDKQGHHIRSTVSTIEVVGPQQPFDLPQDGANSS